MLAKIKTVLVALWYYLPIGEATASSSDVM